MPMIRPMLMNWIMRLIQLIRTTRLIVVTQLARSCAQRHGQKPHLTSPKRFKGQYVCKTCDDTDDAGTSPKTRESREASLLSPITQTQPSSTTCGYATPESGTAAVRLIA